MAKEIRHITKDQWDFERKIARKKTVKVYVPKPVVEEPKFVEPKATKETKKAKKNDEV